MSVFGFGKANIFKVTLVAAAAVLAACLLVVATDESVSASLSKQNGKIAFARLGFGFNYDIYTINPDGTAETRLTHAAGSDSWTDWSSNGSEIAFDSQRDSADLNEWEIYVMDADGSNETRLTDSPGNNFHPNWSDGGKIAFTSSRDGDREIYVMNADGTEQINLTRNSARDEQPAFSPDGTKIAFESDRDGNSEIYTMDADGSDLRRLTSNPGTDETPDWSEDGTNRIAFISSRNSHGLEIYTMDADGGNQTRITHDLEVDLAPSWSPDGTQITFPTTRDEVGDVSGDWDIYTVDADPTSRFFRQITTTEFIECCPDWGSRDTTAPTLKLPTDITKEATGPDGAAVEFKATATDDVDGPLPDSSISYKTDSGTVASGDIFPLGITTVTVTATDHAGNTATGSFQITVKYAFGSGSGGSFGEPVRDTELNRLAAGAGVPVKFGLGADFGLTIFAAGYPTSKQVSCPNGLPPDNVEETSTVSRSGLTYDATSGLYTYVWKTDRARRGTCRELNLQLADGSDHRVQFT